MEEEAATDWCLECLLADTFLIWGLKILLKSLTLALFVLDAESAAAVLILFDD